VGVAVATGTWLATAAEDDYLSQASLVATAFAACALLAALLLKRAEPIPLAIALLVAPYVSIVVFELEGLDVYAPVVAALLFVVAELSYWSLELRGSLADEPGTYLRRIAVLAGLLVVTLAAGTALLVLVEVVTAGGAALDVLGAVAAVGAIALLALAASRRSP
jgi:hypothetical protein